MTLRLILDYTQPRLKSWYYSILGSDVLLGGECSSPPPLSRRYPRGFLFGGKFLESAKANINHSSVT